MTFSIADFFNRLTSSDTHSSVLPEDSLLKKNLLCVDSNAKRLHLVIPESFFNEYPDIISLVSLFSLHKLSSSFFPKDSI